jgi:DNA-directed RNA polymerase subunit N (RpoN/RPB10)
MLLPIRCFTCNRLLADEKLRFFESHRHKKYEEVKAMYQSYAINAFAQIAKISVGSDDDTSNELVIYPAELKEEYRYKPQSSRSSPDAHFTVSPTTEFIILNLLGIEHYCCRRMFLGYVDLIEKIN